MIDNSTPVYEHFNNKKRSNWFIATIIISILFIFGSFMLNWFLCKDLQIQDRGNYGDMFGIVNAIFSGLAFLGIIVNLMYQREDLRIQRDEIRQTNQEFRIQNDTMLKQRFENTFFQMLNLQNQTTSNLKNNSKLVGSDSFNRAKHQLLSNFRDCNIKEKNEDNGDVISRYDYQDNTDVFRKIIVVGYLKFFNNYYENILGHYFRSLYHIFKFIYFSDFLKKDEKKFYASLVRAQLSSDEQYLILYNSMINNLGNPKFLFLIKELDVLQNFDFSVIDTKHKEIFIEKKNNILNPFV